MATANHAVLRLPGDKMFAPSPVHSGGTVWQVAGDETRGAYTIYESILPPGRHIPLHTHDADDEAFYIIAGEITFQLGDETLRATAGSFLFIPHGLPHSQLNTGQTDARRLIIFSPPGFERYFAERAALARSMATLNPATHTGLDADANNALARKYGMTFLADTAARGAATTDAAVVRLAADGATAAPSPVLGGGTVWQVAGDETRGAYTIYDSVVPPGFRVPLHLHENEEEAFYIIAGECTFRLGAEMVRATAGSFVLVPRGMPHNQNHTGQTDTRRLILFSPPGLERYFAELAALAQSGSAPAYRPGMPGTEYDTLRKRYGLVMLTE